MTRTPTIVDTNAMEWISGPDVLADMAPEFRDNLGPADEVADAFSHYYVKPLLREEGTGRRMDLAKFTPGYRDVTACYHESAEEGFCIDGDFDLAFEGHFGPLSYFWRPPGWVHGTDKVDTGATAIFTFEARRPEDGSGPVTRAVATYDAAGENVLLAPDDELRIGPRGYVPNVNGNLVARMPGERWLRNAGVAALLDAPRLAVRILSANVRNGGGTFLWDLAPGYRQPEGSAFAATYHFFVVRGEIALGGAVQPAGTWVYVPAGTALDAMSSEHGALLYMKPDAEFALSG